MELTLKHSGKMAATVMGHNWVLTKSADFQAVANAGVRSTIADSYLPKADARDRAHQGHWRRRQHHGEFPHQQAEQGRRLHVLLLVPGHWAMMKGTLTFG